MSPPTIVQVVRDAHPYGGVGGVACALDDAFRQLGVDTRMITLSSLGLRPGAGEGPRWRVKLRHLWDVVAFTTLGTLAIARARREPGVVILNHGDPLGGDILVNHGLHRALVHARPLMLLRNPVHAFIYAREALRHRLRLYRTVVCLSAEGAEELRAHHRATRGAAVTVIPNGVDRERFRPAAEATDGSGDAFRLIFVGHEFERKGLSLIIDALPLLPATVTLTVVGGSPEEMAAAKAKAHALGVPERIALLGRRRDVPALLREANLLVLPSAAEAWPLVVLEALASGVPALLAPFPSSAELVADGGGFVVARDAGAIAAAVTRIVMEEPRRRSLRDGALRTAAAYDWRRIAERYVSLAAALAEARA